MRKGISPLVATVLLIAATMSIAGILAWWSSTYIKSTLPAVNETEAKCKFAEFAIYYCNYSSSDNTITMILENRRDVTLSDLNMFVIFSDLNTSSFNISGSLPANSMQTYKVNIGRGDYSEIKIKTQCPDVEVKSTCR